MSWDIGIALVLLPFIAYSWWRENLRDRWDRRA